MVSKKRPRVIIFPIDCMKGKAKKQYMNIGKVVIYSMYETIENVPKIEEVKKMDKRNLKNFLIGIKEKHSSKQLQKHWEISSYSLYQMYKENEVPLRNMDKRENNKIKKKMESIIDNEIAITSAEPLQEPQKTIIYAPIEQDDFEGYQMKFSGNFKGEKLSDRVMTYISNLDKEARYKIKMIIEEIAPEDEAKKEISC